MEIPSETLPHKENVRMKERCHNSIPVAVMGNKNTEKQDNIAHENLTILLFFVVV